MRHKKDTASVRLALRIGAALALWFLVGPAPSAVPASALRSSTFTVTYLGGVNIGMILETPSGKTYAIDPGEERDADNMINFLKGKGISTLDGLVITHPHGDHFAAVEIPNNSQDIFGQFTVKTLYHNNCQKIAHDSNAGHTDTGGNGYHGDGAYNDFKSRVLDKKPASTSVQILKAGDILSWDNDLTVKVLAPRNPFLSDYEVSTTTYYTDANIVNEQSIVLWIKHGNVSFLFTGDINGTAMKYLRTNWPDELKNTNVMLIPHHARNRASSLGRQFAQDGGSYWPNARIAIAYPRGENVAEEGDSDGDGIPNTIDVYVESGYDVYRLKFDGTTTVSSNGSGFAVTTDLSNKSQTYEVSSGTPGGGGAPGGDTAADSGGGDSDGCSCGGSIRAKGLEGGVPGALAAAAILLGMGVLLRRGAARV